MAEMDYQGEARRLRENQKREAARAGNSTLDIDAQWVDYASAGVDGEAEMEGRLLEILKTVDLEETLFEIGLKSSVPPGTHSDLPENILRARETMRETVSAGHGGTGRAL